MRSILSLVFFYFTFSSVGQEFKVDTDCIDTLTINSFKIDLNGSVQMGDSVDLTFDILFNDSLMTPFESFHYNQYNSVVSNISAFEFDSNTGLFSAEFGSLNNLNYWLRIRRKVYNEIKEELLIPLFLNL